MKRVSEWTMMVTLAGVLLWVLPVLGNDEASQRAWNAGGSEQEAEWQAVQAPGPVEAPDVPKDSDESHRWRRLAANRGWVLVATAGPPPKAIREAQELLAKLGYAPGSANGMWHTRSIQAYRAFLRDQGRPDSSKLTPQALRVMRRLVERSAGGSVKERKRAQERELTPAQRQALDRYRQRQAQQQRQRNRQARERYRQAQQHAQLKFSDGSHYEGGVRDGKRNGQGTFIWANGSHYEGEWRNDRPHGQGILTMGDGRRYEGQWHNGCFGERNGEWAVAETTAAACGFE